MLTVGRFFPDLIRQVLQKLLIVGKTEAPFRFHRRFEWNGDRWTARDTLQSGAWETVVAAGIGGDQTSIYVVMSRTFQSGQLQPWLDLSKQVAELEPGHPLEVERTF
jgi:hypothetical protein